MPSRKTTSYISIKGLKIYAYHGVLRQENEVGNTFEVDIDLYFDAAEAMYTDRLDLTVNYAAVIEIVRAEMAEPSDLLENVVHRIYRTITSRMRIVTGGRIAIFKPQPPIAAEVAKVGFTYMW
ncbi:MAG: dihydroneopterin aldolase [Muribaculaceae bacterium]|nr:dihydroneopterin aldolase [Muribaculaceae bacterium]